MSSNILIITKHVEMLDNFVHKDKYRQEMHHDMKAMYENLGTHDFRKWHQEKKEQCRDTLCGYFHYYQNVYTFFLVINYTLRGPYSKSPCDHLKESKRFINEMISQKS